MARTAAIPSSRVLIFDTGPLWELITYRAVNELRFRSLSKDILHLRNDSAYKALTEFIAPFRRRTTTAHVVAEISSRITRTERKGHAAIWNIVYTEFSSMGMEEGVLRLLQLPRDVVSRLGAADAGIVAFGLTLNEPIRPLVLSVDFPLISECGRAGIDAKHVRDVVNEPAA